MKYILTWTKAARLRTLPLSVSGILVASAIAYCYGHFRLQIFIWSLLTAVGLQVLSNFANDYGDGVKGTDNRRVGPSRAVQSGAISPKKMKKAMIVTAILASLCALWLIYQAFGIGKIGYVLFFIGLGLLAVVAAIKYTVGKSAYGYRGLGDVFVFIFFGLVSVLGCLFLYTHQLRWIFALPAIAIGLLSVGVLNINNMRDYQSDRQAGKKTLVVAIGVPNAKLYHYNLIFIAMTALMGYTLFELHAWKRIFYMLLFIPLIAHLWRVKKIDLPAKLDPELKRLAILTFLISVCFSLGHII